MRFVVDEQLPAALARWLESQGHVAQHVYEAGLGGSTDLQIWNFVKEQSAALFSKDEDFVSIAKSELSAPLIWVRLGNTTSQELIARMEVVFASVLVSLEAGEIVVEVAQ
jgi:predicted nuclease of predicted toxin-antitoxin system